MIAEKIGQAALLEQTAEEAAELAHAALKLARILRAENPTPVKPEAARAALSEEYADIEVCATELRACGLLDLTSVVRVMEEKRNRWESRLTEAEKKPEKWAPTF